MDTLQTSNYVYGMGAELSSITEKYIALAGRIRREELLTWQIVEEMAQLQDALYVTVGEIANDTGIIRYRLAT